MATLYSAEPQLVRMTVRRLAFAAVAAGIIAAVANLIVFVVAKFVLGIPLVIPMGGAGSPAEPLGPAPVIIASALPAIGAAILLALLNRFVSHPIRIFQIISLIFLVLSLAGPAMLPVDLATKMTLSIMHVVAAAVIVGGLVRLGRQQ